MNINENLMKNMIIKNYFFYIWVPEIDIYIFQRQDEHARKEKIKHEVNLYRFIISWICLKQGKNVGQISGKKVQVLQ